MTNITDPRKLENAGFLAVSLPQRIEYIAFSTAMLIYCVISYIAFILNSDILPSLRGTEIYLAFEDPTYIFLGVTVNISTSIPTVIDLIMDIKSTRDLPFDDGDNNRDVYSNSWIERFFLAALSIFPGSVVLLLRKSVHIPYIFFVAHLLQTLGSIFMVLIICKKHVPKYFTSNNVYCAMFFCSLASFSIVLGFGRSILYLPNILTNVFLCGIFYFLVVRICIPWMKDICVSSISKKRPLSIEESCVVWYFMNTMILFIVHAVVVIVHLHAVTNLDNIDINILVYSLALYSVVHSTVPVRLARIAVEERKKMAQTKTALMRYMSHEVRSPLNVIHSGLNLLVEDMENLPVSEHRNELLEAFKSIRHASGDLLQTMNDLLLLESMDSAAFSIEEEMTPCAHLTQIAENCGLMPREKEINFAVNNQCDSDASLTYVEYIADESEGDDERDTDLELGLAPSGGVRADSELLLFIDEHKIGQVLRNLITNSSKFTPAGKSIVVNIRTATSADLTGTTSDIEENSAGRTRALEFAQEKGYTPCGHVVIEVQDTGVGIAPENWGKVFGQFAQFDANKLQGGGGSGLGLWICQQLVKLHGSEIRFHSDGEGCGTRFFFTLPSFKKAFSDDAEGAAPVGISAQLTSSFSVTSRGARISPEATSSMAASDTAADKFSKIASRPLDRAGVCKVLLVDDSSFNVKVMRNILKKVSATWRCPSPMSTTAEGVEESTVRSDCSKGVMAGGNRGSVYMLTSTLPAATTATTTTTPIFDDGEDLTVNVVLDVSEADDGIVAVKLVLAASEAGCPFDIVFMDNIMVLMHGPEAARAMRAEGFQGIIVGVTGNLLKDDVNEYITSGADSVLAKPVDMKEIQKILSRFTH